MNSGFLFQILFVRSAGLTYSGYEFLKLAEANISPE